MKPEIVRRILYYFLKNCRKKTICLWEIEDHLRGDVEYDDYAVVINDMLKEGILSPIKASGTTDKPISIPNSFRINKSYFNMAIVDRIASYQLKANKNINLQNYYSLGEKYWERDLPYIMKINSYLNSKGIPTGEYTTSELSYRFVGNEKWIDEEGGKVILERIGLWKRLNINFMPDPLMIAVNRNKILGETHMHLIVENKSTFYALMDDIENTEFTSLVYGAGWKITSGISVLEDQLRLGCEQNKVFYFGDLDYEGISIWNAVNEKREAFLAVDFYKEFFKNHFSYGKHGQIHNDEAVKNFLNNFSVDYKDRIMDMLKRGGYYPQEGLEKEKMRGIWRKISWT